MFSVNLTTTALHDEHFIKFVGLCLAKSSLPKGMIAFEIDARDRAEPRGQNDRGRRRRCIVWAARWCWMTSRCSTECFALLRLPGCAT